MYSTADDAGRYIHKNAPLCTYALDVYIKGPFYGHLLPALVGSYAFIGGVILTEKRALRHQFGVLLLRDLDILHE